jgi:hypothetical protein
MNKIWIFFIENNIISLEKKKKNNNESYWPLNDIRTISPYISIYIYLDNDNKNSNTDSTTHDPTRPHQINVS